MRIDEQAAFHRPEVPDQQITGRLIFDQDSGRAELFGDVGGLSMFSGSDTWRKSQRLIAKSQKNLYTLDGCYARSAKSTSMGSSVDTLTLGVQTIVEGVAFEPDEELEFSGISLTPRYLERWSPSDWLSETRFTKEWEMYGYGPLKANYVEPEVLQVDDKTVKLDNRFKVSGDGYATRGLHNQRFCRIDFDGLVPFYELTSIAQDFQDLVSIATGRTAEFEEISVFHPVAEIKSNSGKSHRLPLPIYRRWRAVADEDEKPPTSYDLYFAYDELGGIEGVCRWLAMASKYRDILGRVMVTRYNSHLYLEDQALNRFVALEGFHRTWSQKKNPAYKTRLLELAALAGGPFSELIGSANIETWAKRVVKERNELAHHFGRPADADMTPVLYLSQVGYWLAVLCFLREAQAPEAVFERWLKHPRIMSLAKNIGAVLKASQ